MTLILTIVPNIILVKKTNITEAWLVQGVHWQASNTVCIFIISRFVIQTWEKCIEILIFEIKVVHVICNYIL
jgi:hypothetical protein